MLVDPSSGELSNADLDSIVFCGGVFVDSRIGTTVEPCGKLYEGEEDCCSGELLDFALDLILFFRSDADMRFLLEVVDVFDVTVSASEADRWRPVSGVAPPALLVF